MIGYCVRCKVKTKIKSPVEFLTINGRKATRGECSKCGSNMSTFGQKTPRSTRVKPVGQSPVLASTVPSFAMGKQVSTNRIIPVAGRTVPVGTVFRIAGLSEDKVKVPFRHFFIWVDKGAFSGSN